MRNRVALSAILAGGLAFPAQPRKTVTYHSSREFSLKADLYVPDSASGLRPGIVMIHEGGFTRGGKECFAFHGALFAREGFVAMAVGYRLVQEGGAFPNAVRDCIEALRWLKANAAEFHLDTGRIILLGASAGAYLSTLTALSAGLPENIARGHGGYPDQSNQVLAVVSVFGWYDWSRTQWKGSGFLPAGMGRLASPVTHAEYARGRFLILAGARDRLFPLDDARTFVRALENQGTRVRLHVQARTGHAGICDPAGPVWPWAYPLIREFLTETLR